MKIFHTADVHIREEGDKPWQALEQVIETAKEHGVDYLTISGDLFESDAEADNLRPMIRGLFEDTNFQTLIIPGNHDANAFTSGYYFGGNIKLLSDDDWSNNIFEDEEAVFIGLSFVEMDAMEFHRQLRRVLEEVNTDLPIILLYHGELLDASFDRGAFGPEEGKRYMPSRLSFFAEGDIKYVLAGHFHSNSDVRMFGEDGFFVYPGSPVSITRRETGKRKAVLIEPGVDPLEITLDTFHYQELKIQINAFDQKDPLNVIEQGLDDVDPNAAVLLEISGTIAGSESDLVERVEELTSEVEVASAAYHFKDISNIASHPVFDLFERHLEDLSEAGENISDQKREELRQMVIQAMSEVDL